MILQHLFNVALMTSWLYLIGAGFYLSSISCRHFILAAGGVFLLGPYTILLSRGALDSGLFAVGVALVSCSGAGWVYLSLSRRLFARGARSEQLLLVSFAILGIAENCIALLFGSRSQTLMTERLAEPIVVLGSSSVRGSELLFFVVAGSIVVLSFLGWRFTIFGKKFQALLESRAALSLRGHSVGSLEIASATLGFALIGTAGILWATAMRVRPAMAIEASVVGVVAFILAPLIAPPGPTGLFLAAFGIALVRLGLSLFAEGDWAMSSNLLLLLAALAVGLGRQRTRRSPQALWQRVT